MKNLRAKGDRPLLKSDVFFVFNSGIAMAGSVERCEAAHRAGRRQASEGDCTLGSAEKKELLQMLAKGDRQKGTDP